MPDIILSKRTRARHDIAAMADDDPRELLGIHLEMFDETGAVFEGAIEGNKDQENFEDHGDVASHYAATFKPPLGELEPEQRAFAIVG